MIRLSDLQERVASAIRDGGECVGVHRPAQLPPGEPLSVYRNHHRISLTDALKMTFDLTSRTIGAEAFALLARRFLDRFPPEAPCVAEYGADFASYLSEEPLVAGYPFLIDVARLDWAINRARISRDAPALTVEAFERLSPENLSSVVFKSHPSFTILESIFPLLDIAHLARHPDAGEIDLRREATIVLIWRRDGDVTVRALDPDFQGPLYNLLAGGDLSNSCACLPPEKLPAFFQSCILAGLFVAH